MYADRYVVLGPDSRPVADANERWIVFRSESAAEELARALGDGYEVEVN